MVGGGDVGGTEGGRLCKKKGRFTNNSRHTPLIEGCSVSLYTFVLGLLRPESRWVTVVKDPLVLT